MTICTMGCWQGRDRRGNEGTLNIHTTSGCQHWNYKGRMLDLCVWLCFAIEQSAAVIEFYLM
jgi:hypothetical protein